LQMATANEVREAVANPTKVCVNVRDQSHASAQRHRCEGDCLQRRKKRCAVQAMQVCRKQCAHGLYVPYRERKIGGAVKGTQ